MTEGNAGLTVVELAKKRYDLAVNYWSQSRLLSDDDLLFVNGDGDNMHQWPQWIRDDARYGDKVKLTVNVTAQHCNQIINNIRMNRPQGQVLPLTGGATSESASVMEDFVRAIQSRSNADDAHDSAMEQAVYGGEGYWRAYIDYDGGDSFDKTIRIVPISDYNSVYIDPNARLPDCSDAEWGFIVESISKDRCEREHPGVDTTNWRTDNKWVREDEVLRCEYFYCDYVDDELEQYQDGTTGYKSEENGLPIVKSRKVRREAWKWCKLLGGEDEPVEQEDWPGQSLPIIGSFGKRFMANGTHYVKGLVRDLKDPARILNFSYSSAVESIALQPKAPFVGSAEAIAGHDQWATANRVAHSILPYNEYDGEGRQLSRPQREMPPQMPQAHIEMLTLSTEQMRAASGQSAANFGVKSEASSGVGIQRLKAQGEVATFHFPDNLARALRYEMQILVSLIPHILEDGQVIRTLGLDGKEKRIAVSHKIPQAYMKSPNPNFDGIFNPEIGRYDVAISTGPSYQTQRQESSAIMTEIAARDPGFMQVAGDLFFKSIDLPLSEELAKRYEKMLPPQLAAQDEGEAELPPQVQAQMQQMQQQLQQLDQMLQQAGQQAEQMQMELQKKDMDIMQAEAKAITNEIQAKQANAMLAVTKAEQSLAAKATPMQPEPEEMPEGEDDTREPDEDDKNDPRLDALLWKIEEAERQQQAIMAMVAELAKPRVSTIKVEKQPDGSFAGTKVEALQGD